MKREPLWFSFLVHIGLFVLFLKFNAGSFCPLFALVVGSDIGRLVLRCPLSTCGRLLSRIALRLCLNIIVSNAEGLPDTR